MLFKIARIFIHEMGMLACVRNRFRQLQSVVSASESTIVISRGLANNEGSSCCSLRINLSQKINASSARKSIRKGNNLKGVDQSSTNIRKIGNK